MKTQFDIKFIEDYRTATTVTFIDQTLYNPDTPIKTPILKVVIPYFNKFVELDYKPNQVNFVNSYVLNLGSTNDCLPDGQWKFELSICPNDKLKQEFTYYNISNAMRKIADLLCEDSSDEMLDKMLKFKEQLQTVQLLVDVNRANHLYTFIWKELNRC